MHSWNLAAACVFASACGASVVGGDFHAKYAGVCASSSAPLASELEQSGARWQAARDTLVAEVEGHSGELRRCYVEALANQERLHGRVVLRFVFAPNGELAQILVAENDSGYEPLGCCVAAVARDFHWQLSAAGAGVGLEYPFTFELIRMPLGYREAMTADFAFMEVLASGFKLVLDGAMYGGGPVR